MAEGFVHTAVVIEPEGDLIIKLISCPDGSVSDAESHWFDSTLKINSNITGVLVSKTKLINFGVNYFKRMFASTFTKSPSNTIELKDDDAEATIIIFEIMHGKEYDHDEMSKLTNTNAWHIAKAVDEYNFASEPFQEWFSKWNAINIKYEVKLVAAQTLLYISYFYNHAKAFKRATAVLVHEGVMANKPNDIMFPNPVEDPDVETPMHLFSSFILFLIRRKFHANPIS